MAHLRLNLNELQTLRFALDDVIGYLTDNSCSDPECCGGPYYTEETFDEGCNTLRQVGIEYKHEVD